MAPAVQCVRLITSVGLAYSRVGRVGRYIATIDSRVGTGTYLIEKELTTD